MRKLVAIAALAAGLALVLPGGRAPDGAGEATGPRGLGVAAAAELVAFAGCDDLLAYVKDAALEQVGPYGLGGGGWGIVVDDATDESARAAPQAPAPADEPVSGVDYSPTNVQETGVDEPDIVKTDGSRIVAVTHNRLQLLDVAAGEPRLVASVPVAGWDPQLLLSGDRLLVMTRSTWADAPAAARPGARPGRGPGEDWAEITELTLVDLADLATPRVESTTRVEGSLASARLVDGIARIAIRSQPMGLPFGSPTSGQQSALEDATAANRRVIEQSTLDDWLPGFTRADGGGGVPEAGPLLECAQVHRPAAFAGLGTVSLLTLDLADGAPPGPGVGVVADADTVYASSDSLYVALASWPQPLPGPPVAPEPGVDGLDPVGPRPPRPHPGAPTTQVHKFDIRSPRTATYVGSGTVHGSILSQFSLSEHDGHLRIATTAGEAWGDGSESFVTVLADRDGRLEEVGRVGGLGPGERIYAVRFIGPVGYVVTFRETDPLYTLDLSDPAAPRVLGELKILGYSAYLHPVGERLLLGVGQDATEQGRRLGTQLSLFDVADLHEPVRLDAVTLGGGSDSQVEWDHHAFLWWPAARLAVVPYGRWAPDQGRGEETLAGAVAFEVDPASGITEMGRITHPSLPARPGPRAGEAMWEAPAQPAIRRAWVIDDRLYTLSDAGLKASDLATLRDVAWVQF